MERNEALTRIAWHEVKKLTRDEAAAIIRAFFKEPLTPGLRAQLNITAVIQWETHTPPENLHPGNPIYRPVLIDRMRRRFIGAKNEYLAQYLREKMGMPVESVVGDEPNLLACPVCGYKTFTERGTWHICPVCGWNSDPVQEARPDEPVGANAVSLVQARENFAAFGAVTREKLSQVEADGAQQYLREGGDASQN